MLVVPQNISEIERGLEADYLIKNAAAEKEDRKEEDLRRGEMREKEGEEEVSDE